MLDNCGMINMSNIALYLNFPFCTFPCSYCHYIDNLKFGYHSIPLSYFHIFENQLKSICSKLKGVKLKSIYFGGGTPSLLNDEQIKEIRDILTDYDIKSDEISMELHPIFTNFNYKTNDFFTRYSIAVQSFDAEVLKQYKRYPYGFNEIKKVVELLRKNPVCKVINIDLIFSKSISANSLESINELQPDSVTIYPNTKGRGTERLNMIRQTLFEVGSSLPSYSPIANSKFIFENDNCTAKPTSLYSKLECETFGDIVGVGHNSVSYIGDKSFLTQYSNGLIITKERKRHGSRYIASYLSSLPFGVTIDNTQKYFPELLREHYLFTVNEGKDINEKHTNYNSKTLVCLPETEYLRFIHEILPKYPSYKSSFLSSIGFGDSDEQTIMESYNNSICLVAHEEEELLQELGNHQNDLEKLTIPNYKILVEGIDGSGKDTFVAFLVEELKKRFKFQQDKSISIMGEPCSALDGGFESKRFIEDLDYSSETQVYESLCNNRVASEKRIVTANGICILIRGLVTNLATYNYVFSKIPESLGENRMIGKWDYYIVIDTKPSIADKRIESRGVPRTWRENLPQLSYFSHFYTEYDSELFQEKIIINNDLNSLHELKQQARKLANKLYVTEYYKTK